MLTPYQSLVKRLFDLVLSFLGLMLTGWIIIIACGLASLDNRANGMFSQLRVGRNGRLFRVYKIRTMRLQNNAEIKSQQKSSSGKQADGLGSDSSWTTVTTIDDPRITRLGRFWRKTKIDELPQLINVFLGQMSFVGPRPDVPGFADELEGRDRIILTVRPGITGPATLKYRNEEVLLAEQENPEEYNREVIFPDKVRLNREYVENWSFHKDLIYILKTVFHF